MGEHGMARLIDWEELGGRSPTHFRLVGKEHGASFCVLVVDFEPGEGPRLHRHPYEEIFVLHEGQATFTAGEETIEAELGQIAFVPAGTPHCFVNPGPGRLRLTSVHPRPHSETEWLDD